MPRDSSQTQPPQPSPSLLSLALQFAQEAHEQGDDLEVSGLPPTRAPFSRSERKAPIPDLAALSKVWMLIGPGGGGKTVIARYLAGEMLARGLQDRAMMAALDPTNRTLGDFFEGVAQPPSSDPAETVVWLRNLLQFIAKRRLAGVLDFGGGDLSLARLVEATPTIADTMEHEGVALIATYVLSPRVDDLASLVTFEQQGFRPRATALVLNLAKADTPAAFDAVRRQPAYRAALDRGAVELWMPALSQSIALRIEQARVQFRQAQDGEAPTGRKPAAISLLERVEVREFLERVATEVQPIEGWMLWS